MADLHLRVIGGQGVCPEFPHVEVLERHGVSNFEQTVLHQSAIAHRDRRAFRLSWDNATEGQVVKVRELFSRAGTVKAMNYYPPDGAGIVEVRFTGPLEVERRSLHHFGMSFEVEEVF